MDKESFIDTMNYMGASYGKTLTKEMYQVWYSFFKDYDIDTFKNAIYQAISEEKYFPSIAIIKEIIVKQTNPNVSLNAEQEWLKVLESIRRYGWEEEKALNSLNEVTRNVTRRIGYNEICMADENRKYNLRSAFLRAFENEKNDIITYDKLKGSNIQSEQLENIENRLIVNSLIKQLAQDHTIPLDRV